MAYNADLLFHRPLLSSLSSFIDLFFLRSLLSSISSFIDLFFHRFRFSFKLRFSSWGQRRIFAWLAMTVFVHMTAVCFSSCSVVSVLFKMIWPFFL